MNIRLRFSASSLLLTIVFVLAAVSPCLAQQDALNESGFKAYGSYQNGDIDSINMVNLKPTIVIPLLSYPQLGSLHFGFDIVYHLPVFVPDVECPPDHPTHDTCSATYGANTGISIEPDFVYENDPSGTADPNTGSYSLVQGPGIAQHTMRSINAPLGSFLGDWLSSDGTAIRTHYTQTSQGGVLTTTSTMTDADGISYQQPSGGRLFGASPVLATDPNGNTITANLSASPNDQGVIVGWTDSVGRKVPYIDALFVNPVPPELSTSLTQDYSGCTGALPTVKAYLWNVPGEGGSTVQYKVCYVSLTFTTTTIPTCSAPNCSATTIPFLSIQSIVLPHEEGSPAPTWTFTYDQAGGYADLKSITLPTGGVITYTWGNNTYCSTSSFGWSSMSRAISKRTVDAKDGSGPQPWTYQQITAGQGQPLITTVTDPLGNVTVHTLTPQAGYCALYETQTDQYQGASLLLKSVETTYSYTIDPQSTLSPALTRIFNVVPQTKKTTLKSIGSSHVKQVSYTYDSGVVGNQTQLLYGQVTRQQETDFGNSSPGTVLKQTNSSYLWQSNPSYQTANLINFPCLATIYSGSTTTSQPNCAVPSVQSNQVAQTQYAYDENNGSPQGVRGNNTSVTRWLSGGTSPREQRVFTPEGMPYIAKDPAGNSTTTTYDSSGLFPKTVERPMTNGVHHIDGYTYDLETGLLQNQTDENGQITSYNYDGLRRITGITYPSAGGTETYDYNDASPNPSFTYTRSITASQPYTSLGQVDGLGRKILQQVTSDGNNKTVTTYDALGRVASISDPYRSTTDFTYGKATFYTYDALGRKIVRKNPDASTNQWCYDGITVNSTLQTDCKSTLNLSSQATASWIDYYDETGRHWQQLTDGFGRLTAVMEPEATVTPSLQTDYQYDALDNLLKVDQWGGATGSTGNRLRLFTYDSLSRLTYACNPESIPSASSCTASGPWSDTYTYDANGNLHTRIDARLDTRPGVPPNSYLTTTYSYDVLNRITNKVYTNDPQNTPGVVYFYDLATSGWGWPAGQQPQTNLIGRLAGISVGSPNAWILYGYDAMGRKTLKSECLPRDCGNNHHDMRYQYDLAGDMTFYDRGTDLDRNTANPNQGYYFGGFTIGYDGGGNIKSVTADTPDTNHPALILGNAVYTPFGSLSTAQMVGVYLQTRSYDVRGRYTGVYVSNTATQPIWNTTTGYFTNGSVSSSTDTWNGSWSYLYGNTNRLAQAIGPNFTLAHTYDHWGNRTSQLITAGSGTAAQAPQWSHGYNANNRQAAGLTYDAAGNVTYDGFHTYTYDAENRINSVDGATTTYGYDGENNRVVVLKNGVIQTEFLYDFQGRLMTEIGLDFKAARANIYVGNKLFAEDAPDPYLTSMTTATLLRITDQVGTLRARWDEGSNWVGACSSLAFGDAVNCNVSPSDMQFTGKQRDSESGLDYFGARYYNSTGGRFMSPDWSAKGEPVPYAKLDNPQTLNLYSYDHNDPLSLIDPDGHCDSGTWCNLVQRFANWANGLGFHTDSQVESILHQDNLFLRQHGIPTEGLTGAAVMKTFQTYTRRNLNGGSPYSGRTSGTGDPLENIAKRNRYQPKAGTYGPAELDKSSMNPDAIRGREQQNMDANGGARSEGGTSGNAIRGISKSNPNIDGYMRAAQEEFGDGPLALGDHSLEPGIAGSDVGGAGCGWSGQESCE